MAEFTDVLDRHVRAIRGRDIAEYSATIHDDVTVILPTGRRLTGRGEVEEFHREFFADHDWTQDMTLLRVAASGSTGTALYEADYRDVDGNGDPIRSRFLVGFVFVQVGSDWFLLHDQCTRLPEE